MTNFIVIILLAVIFFFALRSTIKHFRGEGGCCGGSAYKARKKKLAAVACKKTFVVEGMSCQNCVNRVMEAVNSINGLSAAVHLKSGLVVVSMEHPVEDDIIINAIQKAGYKVTRTKA